MYITESLCCTAEINTTLQLYYNKIKKKKKKGGQAGRARQGGERHKPLFCSFQDASGAFLWKSWAPYQKSTHNTWRGRGEVHYGPWEAEALPSSPHGRGRADLWILPGKRWGCEEDCRNELHVVGFHGESVPRRASFAPGQLKRPRYGYRERKLCIFTAALSPLALEAALPWVGTVTAAALWWTTAEWSFDA